MRLGREEAIALPQYISLCLTGRCNAQCGFCSVTINRTGVLKKNMPFEKIMGFLAPALPVARMVGLEGNGEPTLYSRFDDTVGKVTEDGSLAYLITNGARINSNQIPVLLKLETINFSLNAATAETHEKIMKLREFDHIVNIIKELIVARKENYYPRIAVSMVVENNNVHEVPAFLYFAEHNLGVDRIYLRPLSELGSDISVVEDLRDLVPHESDVIDMLDAVEDYLAAAPRKAEIIYERSSFKADRPDPVDRVLMPHGCEDRLLGPRRHDWHPASPAVLLSWRLNRVQISVSGKNKPGVICSTNPIPTDPGRTLSFDAEMTLETGVLTISVTDVDGNPLAHKTFHVNSGEAQRISLSVNTEDNEYVRLVVLSDGQECGAEIDFGRLRTPAPGARKVFRLPHRHHWEVDSKSAQIQWPDDQTLTLSYTGERWKYLIKSFFVPCLPDETITLNCLIIVEQGELSIGFLDENADQWVKQWTFTQGPHDTVLSVHASGNSRMKLVLYSEKDTPLKARIGWGQEIHTSPQTSMAQGTVAKPSTDASDVGEATSKPATDAKKRSGHIFKYLIFGKTRYACHKPWTDMANFTVGGRIDVCCIATGDSQKRYELGDFTTQNLQEIWNGKRMREFRRTVNSKEPLPPCARCPMLYAYQGPFFDSSAIIGAIRKRILPNASGAVSRSLQKAIITPIIWSLKGTIFRGFKNH